MCACAHNTPGAVVPRFVVTSTEELTDAVIAREVEYAREWIEVCSLNESPWNYIRGLMRAKGESEGGGGFYWRFYSFPQVRELCERHRADTTTKCTFARALLFEVLLWESTVAPPSGEGEEVPETHPVETRAELGAIADELIAMDPIRAKYWQRRKNVALGKRGGSSGITPPAELDSDADGATTMATTTTTNTTGAGVQVEPLD